MHRFCVIVAAGACLRACARSRALADDAAGCSADASASSGEAACAEGRGGPSRASSLIQTAGRLARADSDLSVRPCTERRKSRCCGDGLCDGPETPRNCPLDCDGPETTSPAPGATTSRAPPGGSPGNGGVRPCTEQLTSRCCGDGACDGPETPGNCADDCAGGGDGDQPGEPDGPVPSPAPGACATVPAERPVVPTLCAAENKGCCDCGTSEIKTFVFWTQDMAVQRCIHTHNFPSVMPDSPMPVVLHVDGYGGGRKGPESGGDMGDAARYYDFVVITVGSPLKDGAGGFGLEFGNNGIANDDNPAPCSSGESREIEYLEEIFQFIADQPLLLDAAKVYTEGFSQNSMFAAYTAVCFADRVAGAWQGGSGQMRTGSTPVAPGFQAQCSFDSHALHGRDCCEADFCTDCQYWPLWPKTCSHKVVDCIAAYTDDRIACGSDWYMYQAMVQEGNDARLLSFPVPSGDTRAGHRDPRNKWAWFAGCLGVAPSCSSSCAASFDACIQAATEAKTYKKFERCEGALKAGELAGCVVGCAPTLAMLQQSESPVVTLSEGRFGTETGLPSAGLEEAPRPNCVVDFGNFSTGPGNAKCTPPASYTAPPINPKDECA